MHNHKGKKGVFSGFAKTSVALLALFVLVIIISTSAAQAKEISLSTNAAQDQGQPLVVGEAQSLTVSGQAAVSEPKGATGSEIYMVRLSDPPVAAYRGGITGLRATNPSVRGQDKLDMDSVDAVAYRDYLEVKQADLITSAERELGRELDVVYQYQTANNGFAAYMTPEEAQRIAGLPGVVHVQRDVERELHTDNGPAWIGAPSVWATDSLIRHLQANLTRQGGPQGTFGFGTFTYDFTTRELSWYITHNVGHSNYDRRSGRIRVDLPGTQSDYTLVSFPGTASSPIQGSDTLTVQEQGYMMEGRFRVQILRDGDVDLQGTIVPLAAEGNMGQGIIVGVIDTGINPRNPSFADIGGDGYNHTNPWGAGNYVGVCDSGTPATYDPTFPCNDKLIGAWGYSTVNGGDPRDYDGHGSHTASTAAGNVVFDAEVVGPTISLERAISGVAPHANIIAYAACCTGSALAAAIDQAVADGVDVINYSIGSSSPSSVWNDFDTVGYLNAREAGIFVATSAGNDGPGDETVGSPADAPWLLSVGATTHDRALVNSVVDMSGGDATAPADIFGAGFAAGYGPAPIVYAGDYGYPLCGTGASGPASNPWPADTFDGQIVICDRGAYGRVEKGANLAAAGAGGMILANDAASGDSLNGDAHALPAVHITYADGVVLKAWVASGTGHTGTIGGFVLDEADENGDIMAAFSSRGANRALADIIVPSVSAPGVDIMAAYGIDDPAGGEWGFVSGTSMASPHAAGAAALLMAAHPNWTPAEIQSVLMTTAWTGVLDDDAATPATPFDMGSGRIDLTAALGAGLVLDETIANYEDANPATGGDPSTLNLPSFGSGKCVQTCSWTRTVSSVLSVPMNWTASTESSFPITVEPASFTLAPGASQQIVVTADVRSAPVEEWAFGSVILQPAGSSVSTARMPLAAYVATSTDAYTIQKDVSAATAPIGETLTYTITVGNRTGAARSYDLTDVVPDGVTYVPDSATSGLVYDETTDTLSWTGEVPPSSITIAEMLPFEGYLSLGGLGVTPLGCPSNCDEGGWILTGLDLNYLGVQYDTAIMSINGTLEPGAASGLASSWQNRSLPNVELPNNLLAPWWTDLDASSTGNLYAASLTGGPGLSYLVFEWENIPRWNSPGSTATFQIWHWQEGDETWFTYGPRTGTIGNTTIGAEDEAGLMGATYYFNGSGTVPALDDELLVELNTSPVVLTFQATVDDVAPDTRILNEVEVTDGATTEMAWARTVVETTYRPELSADQTDEGAAGETIVYSMDVTNTGNVADSFTLTVDGVWAATVDPATTGSLAPGAIATFEVSITIPADALGDASDIATVTATSVGDDSVADTATLTTTVEDFYGVELSDDQAQEGLIDTDVSYTLTVTNTGNVADSFALTVDSNWNNAIIPTNSGSLAPGASTTFEVIISVPDDVNAGTTDVATVTATSDTDATTTDTATVTTTATHPPFNGVELSPDQAADGLVGTDVSYTLVVTNTGNVADSFTLTVDGVWTATVDPATTESLEPGESATLEVTVTVPADAEADDMDVTTVTATSVGDDSVSDTAELTTTATVDVTYGVELSATPAALTGYVGRTVVYTVNITNLGSDTDSFTLVASGNGWTTTITPDEITLLANESAELTVAVAIPLTAAAGATDAVTITATSDGDPEVSDTVTLTTTAQRFGLFFPVIGKNG